MRLGNADRAARIDLLIRYARATNFSGRDLDEARAAAQEAVGLADGAGDRRAGGRARAVLSATLWSLDRLEESRTAAAEAVVLLTGTGAVEDLARAHAALVRVESIAFDPAEAIAHGQAALAAAAEAGLDEARIDTLISLGLAHGHRGSHEARPLLEQARGEAGPVAPRSRSSGPMSTRCRSRRTRATARGPTVVAQDALVLFDEFETTIPRQYVIVIHARTLVDRGRYDDALARLVEGRYDWHGGLVVADAVEGLVQARRGEGNPRRRLLAALAEIEALPPGWRHICLRAALAEEAWIAGDLEQAPGAVRELASLRRSRASSCARRGTRCCGRRGRGRGSTGPAGAAACPSRWHSSWPGTGGPRSACGVRWRPPTRPRWPRSPATIGRRGTRWRRCTGWEPPPRRGRSRANGRHAAPYPCAGRDARHWPTRPG